MERFFNMDNGFFRFMTRVADLLILNITFIICCLPVFTIGAALTGLYYVALKMAENDEGYIFKGFLKSFRENFKQATILWLIILALGIALVLDIMIMRNASGILGTVFLFILGVVALFLLMVFQYIFPLQARFVNTIPNTLRNAFLFSVIYLPRTIGMLVLSVGSVLVTLWNAYTITYGLLIWLLVGFALLAYLNSMLLKGAFAKYIPKDDQGNPDYWEVKEEETTKEDVLVEVEK